MPDVLFSSSAWWQPVLLVAVTALALVVVRSVIRSSLGAWLGERRRRKAVGRQTMIVVECRHVWNLHISHTFSWCTLCGCYTRTLPLLRAREAGHPGLRIANIISSVYRDPAPGDIGTDDPIS